MAGTRAGGLKTAESNKAKYGDDFYRQIGLKGKAGWIANGRSPRGFAKDKGLASRAGVIGGRTSKRRAKVASDIIGS